MSSVNSWPLKRKLFSYMLILTCFLILLLITALFLGDRFSSIETSTSSVLNMQLKIFEKDVTDYFDNIAAKGIDLSKNISGLLEKYLAENDMSFEDLNDNPESIADIQEILFGRLTQQIQLHDCSGVYVMLDATVNSGIENAKTSKTGLYLQTNGYKSSYKPIVLLRGNSDMGRANGISPHRKWRLEFNTEMLSCYDEIISSELTPITRTYRFSDMFSIQGTDTRLMLLCVPVVSSDGDYYGICGYEISESYFMANYAQPSNLDNITYLFTAASDGTIDTENGLSCGIYDGYYMEPHGLLTVKTEKNSDLCTFVGDDISYIGVTKNVTLSPNNTDYTLSVMMRKIDFDNANRSENIKNVMIWIVLISAAVLCCYYFSQRFLSPILKSLEQLKTEDNTDPVADIPEIADLFEFLARKDREHEVTMNELETKKQLAENEKQMAQSEKEALMLEFDKIQKEYSKLQSELSEANQERRQKQTEFEKAQTELDRLAYSRLAEI
nr:hypothetical protein [Clostridia bacterium]